MRKTATFGGGVTEFRRLRVTVKPGHTIWSSTSFLNMKVGADRLANSSSPTDVVLGHYLKWQSAWEYGKVVQRLDCKNDLLGHGRRGPSAQTRCCAANAVFLKYSIKREHYVIGIQRFAVVERDARSRLNT